MEGDKVKREGRGRRKSETAKAEAKKSKVGDASGGKNKQRGK
jgi:hypothetical protein